MAAMIKHLGMLLMWLTFHVPANADTPKKELQFVFDTFPLLVEIKDGRVCGIGHHLAKMAAENLGYQHTFEQIPLKRAIQMVRDQKRDAIISVYKTDEREKYLRYTEMPFYMDHIHAFALKSNAVAWDGTIKSLRSHRIGLMNGWYYSDRFRELEGADQSYQFVWLTQLENSFSMLLLNRVDVLISNLRNYQQFIARRSLDEESAKIVALSPPLESLGIYIAFSVATPPQLLTDFNAELKRLLQDKEIQKALVGAHQPCSKNSL